MKIVPDHFELPLSDPRHLELRYRAWADGPHTECRYWLGRTLGENLFRCTFEELDQKVTTFLTPRFPQSPWLARASQKFLFAAIWFQAEFRNTDDGKAHPIGRATKEEKAIVLLMEDPAMSDDDICCAVNCSMNEMKRWYIYRVAREDIREADNEANRA